MHETFLVIIVKSFSATITIVFLFYFWSFLKHMFISQWWPKFSLIFIRKKFFLEKNLKQDIFIFLYCV